MTIRNYRRTKIEIYFSIQYGQCCEPNNPLENWRPRHYYRVHFVSMCGHLQLGHLFICRIMKMVKSWLLLTALLQLLHYYSCDRHVVSAIMPQSLLYYRKTRRELKKNVKKTYFRKFFPNRSHIRIFQKTYFKYIIYVSKIHFMCSKNYILKNTFQQILFQKF